MNSSSQTPQLRVTVHNTVKTKSRKLGKVAVIDVDEEIGEQAWWEESPKVSKRRIKRDLQAINAVKADTIVVNIDSLGGSANHGLKIHDALREQEAKHGTRIITRVWGMTASAATIISQAASKGDRQMSENSFYLIHNAWNVAIGDKQSMLDSATDLITIDGVIAKLYAKRSGTNDADYYAEIMNRAKGIGVWLDAGTARKHKLIDGSFEPDELEAMNRAKNRATFKNMRAVMNCLPEIPKSKSIMAKKKNKGKNGALDAILAQLDKVKSALPGQNKKKQKAASDDPEVKAALKTVAKISKEVDELKAKAGKPKADKAKAKKKGKQAKAETGDKAVMLGLADTIKSLAKEVKNLKKEKARNKGGKTGAGDEAETDKGGQKNGIKHTKANRLAIEQNAKILQD